MSIAPADFSSYVVVPALQMLAPVGIPYSELARMLLMGTAAAESSMASVLVQEGGGPGIGPFMATPDLVPDIMSRLSEPQRAAILKVGDPTDNGAVISNLTLAAMLARAWYWVDPHPLPLPTVTALGQYWKDIYNSAAGAGTATYWATQWKLTGITLAA